MAVWKWVVIPVGFITYIYYNYRKTYLVWKRQGVPGPTPWPLIGTFGQFITCNNFYEMELENKNKYGEKGYYGVYMGPTPCLVITDLELIKEVYVKRFDEFCNRMTTSHIQMKYMTYDIAKLRDDEWRQVRNKLTPSFTGSKLKAMVPLVNFIGDNLGRKFEKLLDSGDTEFNVKETYRNCTIDIICNIAFGTNVDSEGDPENKVTQACYNIIKEVENLMGKPGVLMSFMIPAFGNVYKHFDPNYGMNMQPFETIEAIFKEVHRRMQDAPYERRPDFLHSILEQYELYEKSGGKEGFNWEVMISQAIEFLFVGFETTANALMWVNYYLALNQDIQDQVYEELHEVLCDREQIGYEELSQLEVLDSVVKETLRLSATIRTDRESCGDTTIGDGIHIPKGTLVDVGIYAVHMDPEIWGDPEEFRPSRFQGEENEARSPYAFLAFGLGPRNCIGMRLALFSVKMALTKIFKKYRINPTDSTPLVPKDLKKTKFKEPSEPFVFTVSRR